MKKISFSALFILTTLMSCLAQLSNLDGNYKQLVDKQAGSTGSPLYFFKHDDIKGSPFYDDDWKISTIFIEDTMFKNIPLKFDIYNNEFVFERNDTSYKLNDRVFEVRMFSKNGDSAVFKNGFEIDNKIKKENYLQILTAGKISFLKNLKKTIEQYKEYNDPTTYKQFEEANQYYISKNGNLESIRINKKDLQSLLADKWNKVGEYLSQKNFTGKDEKSFTAAINYYNSL